MIIKYYIFTRNIDNVNIALCNLLDRRLIIMNYTIYRYTEIIPVST